jgi:hypothetical protein
MCLFFYLALVVVEFLAIYDFAPNKSCKTYLGPMLPPGDIKWQLISPHYTDHIDKITIKGQHSVLRR